MGGKEARGWASKCGEGDTCASSCLLSPSAPPSPMLSPQAESCKHCIKMAIKEPMDGAGKGIADGNQEAKETQRMKQPGEGR